MAFKPESDPEDFKNVNTSINHLMYSIGRLKFSLRALSSMHFQIALLPDLKDESSPIHVRSSESNKILENVINEVASLQLKEKDGSLNASDKKSAHILTSVEELEMVHQKLNEEYIKMQSQYYGALAGKVKPSRKK